MDFFDFIARPFGALMMGFYNIIHDYGISIILLAVVIKVILLPFQMKSKRGQMKQMRLQPMVAELQKKHGTNKAKLNEEMMKLYKEEGVNPASGCLWGILPMPIMIAIFQIIRKPISNMMGVDGNLISDAYTAIGPSGGAPAPQNDFYAQIDQSIEISNMGIDRFIDKVVETDWALEQAAGQFADQIDSFELTVAQANEQWMEMFSSAAESLQNINFNFLGLNLSTQPDWQFLWSDDLTRYSSWIAGFLLFLIPLMAGGAQFLSMRITRKFNPQPMTEGKGKGMQTFFMIMPVFSLFIGYSTPAALGFYWTVSSVLQTCQDVWLNKVFKKKLDAEQEIRDAQRKKREEEIEEKRLETERKKAEGLIAPNRSTSRRKKQKSSKQEQLGKAAQWEKKNKPAEKAKTEAHEPSRVGNRRYARGRAYNPDRYTGIAPANIPESINGDEDALEKGIDDEYGRDDMDETEFEDDVDSDDEDYDDDEEEMIE